MYVIGYPLAALADIVSSLLFFYMIIVIASAVVSWVNPDPLNPIVRFLRMMTEPVYEKLRPYIPVLGGLDLTPLAVLLVIAFVRLGILPIIAQFAHSLM